MDFFQDGLFEARWLKWVGRTERVRCHLVGRLHRHHWRGRELAWPSKVALFAGVFSRFGFGVAKETFFPIRLAEAL